MSDSTKLFLVLLVGVVIAVWLAIPLWHYLQSRTLCDFEVTGRDFHACVELPNGTAK
jgi:hypothetical protein